MAFRLEATLALCGEVGPWVGRGEGERWGGRGEGVCWAERGETRGAGLRAVSSVGAPGSSTGIIGGDDGGRLADSNVFG